jgi:hypothetical protein
MITCSPAGDVASLPKVIAFLSFQINHPMRKKRELKPRRAALGTTASSPTVGHVKSIPALHMGHVQIAGAASKQTHRKFPCDFLSAFRYIIIGTTEHLAAVVGSFALSTCPPFVSDLEVVLDKFGVKHWEYKSSITFKLLSLQM